MIESPEMCEQFEAPGNQNNSFVEQTSLKHFSTIRSSTTNPSAMRQSHGDSPTTTALTVVPQPHVSEAEAQGFGVAPKENCGHLPGDPALNRAGAQRNARSCPTHRAGGRVPP